MNARRILLALALLLLGMAAAFEECAASTGAAMLLWVVSLAVIARHAMPILASLLESKE